MGGKWFLDGSRWVGLTHYHILSLQLSFIIFYVSSLMTKAFIAIMIGFFCDIPVYKVVNSLFY